MQRLARASSSCAPIQSSLNFCKPVHFRLTESAQTQGFILSLASPGPPKLGATAKSGERALRLVVSSVIALLRALRRWRCLGKSWLAYKAARVCLVVWQHVCI